MPARNTTSIGREDNTVKRKVRDAMLNTTMVSRRKRSGFSFSYSNFMLSQLEKGFILY